jgi:hypothetical protein
MTDINIIKLFSGGQVIAASNNVEMTDPVNTGYFRPENGSSFACKYTGATTLELQIKIGHHADRLTDEWVTLCEFNTPASRQVMPAAVSIPLCSHMLFRLVNTGAAEAELVGDLTFGMQ